MCINGPIITWFLCYLVDLTFKIIDGKCIIIVFDMVMFGTPDAKFGKPRFVRGLLCHEVSSVSIKSRLPDNELITMSCFLLAIT